MKQSELDWFAPLWRRVALVVFLIVWCAWEWIWGHDQLFQALVSGALVYALYNYFYAWPRRGKKGADDDTLPPQRRLKPDHSEASRGATSPRRVLVSATWSL